MASYAGSKTTTDHATIQAWAEARAGRPACVAGTEGSDEAGVLRIDFNDHDDGLGILSWQDFFATFDEQDLAFRYQEETAGGEESRFFRFVRR